MLLLVQENTASLCSALLVERTWTAWPDSVAQALRHCEPLSILQAGFQGCSEEAAAPDAGGRC